MLSLIFKSKNTIYNRVGPDIRPNNHFFYLRKKKNLGGWNFFLGGGADAPLFIYLVENLNKNILFGGGIFF